MDILNDLKENISEDPLYYSLITIITILTVILLYYVVLYIKRTYFDSKNTKCNNQIKRNLIKKNLNKLDEPSNISREKEVFNISDNVYTYYDAKALCKAYNAELASYDQVNNALKDGAEWCNYGWSKNQMALYPTQKSTWERMQKGAKEYRDDCGRPGINGGYFDDPKLRFGVNCYGIKPKPTKKDLKLLNYRPMPGLSKKEKEFNKRVQEFKNNLKENTILPFKPYNWTKYSDNIGNIYKYSELKNDINDSKESIKSAFNKAEKKVHNFDQIILKGANNFKNKIEKGVETVGDEMRYIYKK